MALHIPDCSTKARPRGEARARPRRRPETWALRLAFAFAFAVAFVCACLDLLGRDLLLEAVGRASKRWPELGKAHSIDSFSFPILRCVVCGVCVCVLRR